MPIHDWARVPLGLFHEFHQSWSVRLKDALNGGRLPEGYFALVEQPEADDGGVSPKPTESVLMPIHDWTQVPSGLFHAFHQSWSIRIMDALNAGRLTDGYYALVEQRVDGPEPDVIAVQTQAPQAQAGVVATLDPPRAHIVLRTSSEAAAYARRANRISIRHPLGQVVALIELVSPGNKDSRHALRAFVDKAVTFLRNGIHLLVVDLFPPGDRDPQGLHKAIWDEFTDEPFTPPPGKPYTLVSYRSAAEYTAYLEPLGLGEAMPDMPLFLAPNLHVMVPLEATYQATWEVCPEPIRQMALPRQTTGE